MSKTISDKKKFEEAMDDLEKVVEKLEQEEISLEESMSCFQNGLQLAIFCRNKLEKAEHEVERLNAEFKNGQVKA